jgi:acetyl-CoA synthetase
LATYDAAEQGTAVRQGTTGTAATVAFRSARDVLFTHRDDPAAAREAFRWPQPAEFNWALDWFDAVAHDNDATALHLVGEDGDVVLGFAELAARSDRVAAWLQSLGVGRGDPVLLALGHGPEVWEATLAVAKLGAVAVPTPVHLSAAQLAGRATRTGARHIVADAPAAERLGTGPFPGQLIGQTYNLGQRQMIIGQSPGNGPGHTAQPLPVGARVAVGGDVPGWERYEDAHEADPGERFHPDGPTAAQSALLYSFTSGTTARPKLVVHTHAGYGFGHLSTMYWTGLRPGDRHLGVETPGTTHHLWGALFVPWSAEAAVVSLAPGRARPAGILDALRTREVTSFCAPPAVWHALCREGLGRRPERLREALATGDRLAPGIVAAVHDAWGVVVRNGYCQAETAVQVGVPPGRAPQSEPGAMGWPLPGYHVEVVDPATGRAAAAGRPGEIRVDLAERPLGLMAGYVAEPQRTARTNSGGWHRTGDLAVRSADGSLSFVGRADDMFVSFGQLIRPLELEDVLLRHRRVAEAAVVAFPDPVGGWVPKAFVVLDDHGPGDPETALSVLAEARQALPPEKRVRVVEFVAELPKAASGAVRRSSLRAAPSTRGGTEYRLRG